jgi:hypothetical protein
MFIRCDLSLVDGFAVLSVISCDAFVQGFVVVVTDVIVVIIDDVVFVVVYVTLSSGHNKAYEFIESNGFALVKQTNSRENNILKIIFNF